MVHGLLWLGFFAAILLSWVWLYLMALDMGGMTPGVIEDMGQDMDGAGAPDMDMPGAAPGDKGAMSPLPDDMDGSRATTAASGAEMIGTDAMASLADGTGPTDPGGMDGMASEVDGPGPSGVGATGGSAADMDATDAVPGPAFGTTGGMGGPTTMAPPAFGPLAAMWAAMMAAMMLPTLVPTMRAYDDLIRSAGVAGASRGGWVGVVAGYLGVWIVAALVLAALQIGLARAGLASPMGAATGAALQAGLLIAAGAWQFSRAKEICHGVCHAPTIHFLGHWRPGVAGGARMGTSLGAFCVGCCWAIMGLGFVGGAMNLVWMGGATAFMIVEKLPQVGHYVMRPAGAALIVAGVAVAIRAI